MSFMGMRRLQGIVSRDTSACTEDANEIVSMVGKLYVDMSTTTLQLLARKDECCMTSTDAATAVDAHRRCKEYVVRWCLSVQLEEAIDPDVYEVGAHWIESCPHLYGSDSALSDCASVRTKWTVEVVVHLHCLVHVWVQWTVISDCFVHIQRKDNCSFGVVAAVRNWSLDMTLSHGSIVWTIGEAVLIWVSFILFLLVFSVVCFVHVLWITKP